MAMNTYPTARSSRVHRMVGLGMWVALALAGIVTRLAHMVG